MDKEGKCKGLEGIGSRQLGMHGAPNGLVKSDA